MTCHDVRIFLIFLCSAQMPCEKCLRTAGALHSSAISGHIAAKSLFFFLVPAPLLLERIQCHLHDVIQDLTLSLLLDAVNQLIQDPRARNELQVVISCCTFK